MSGSFPLILFPETVLQAQQASAHPEPFRQSAPDHPGSPPTFCDYRILGLQGVGGGLVALGASFTPFGWILGLGILVVVMMVVGWQVWQSGQTYARRLSQYQRSMDFYTEAMQAYEADKQEHERLEALKQIPGGLAQHRHEKVLSILKKTRRADGDHSDAPEGYSEAWLEHHLHKVFGNQIYNGLRIAKPDWERFYSPDFTFIDPDTGLHIDIEVDEPYFLADKRPTHCLGDDHERNQHILSYGWVVVRFSESQVVQQPMSCCKVIADIVADLTGHVDPLLMLDGIPELQIVPQWVRQDALEMAHQQLRRPYLAQIPEEFRPGFQSETPKPVKKAPSRFIPSAYQQAIFDFIESGSGDGVVIAVAGSGKSTTLVEAAKRLKTSNGIFLAFNSKIAKALSHKLGTLMEARTFNSLGYSIVKSALGPVKIVDDKYKTLALHHCKAKQAYAFSELSRFARQALVDPTDTEALADLAAHHRLNLSEPLLERIPDLLEEGKHMAVEKKVIDFSDQVWLPVVMNWQGPQYDIIFGDEAQDFNACQLEFLTRLRQAGGRLVLVGDPFQSIYGFAGADVNSVDKIIERLQPTVMPLSICYRCPRRHIRLAQEIVPSIEAKDDASGGIVATLKTKRLALVVRSGDLVIGRKTAPLVKMSLQLLHKGIPTIIAGKNIGQDLVSLTEEVSRLPNFQFHRFLSSLNELERQKRDQLKTKRRGRSLIEDLKDRVDALRYCYRNSESTALGDFCEELKQQFKDNDRALVLSSVHQAKGLEAKRVFILKPDELPLKWEGQQRWELQQEMNLRYVALTRATHELYFVED